VAALAACLVCAAVLCRPAASEVITRKDGRKIEGQIVGEDALFYQVQTANGTFQIRKTDVASITGRRATSDAERKAREALAAGNLDEALEQFRQALKEVSEPEDRKALQAEITAVSRKIEAREEQRFSSQLATADRLIEEKQFSEALIELERLLRKNPDPSPAAPLIRRRMGELHMAEAAYYEDQINYSEAADAYQKAIDLMPDAPEPYLRMGSLVKNRGGKMVDVIDYYRKGIDRALKTRQESDLLDEYYELGQAYLREAAKKPKESQQKIIEAIRCLLVVLRNGANRFPFVAMKLEEGFEMLGETNYDTDTVIKILQSTLEINPEAQKARWILAEVYSKVRQYDKVIEELQTIKNQAAQTGAPLPDELHYRLGLAYLAKPPADLDAALDAFEDEIRQNKRNYMALIEAARIHSLFGNYDDALRYCEDAMKLLKDRPEAYWVAGDVYMRRARLGDLREAELTLNRALILKPDFQQARVKLAEIQILQQRKSDEPDFTAAEKLLEEAIQGITNIDPGDLSDEDRKVKADAILWKAEIEYDRRNHNEAARLVDEALDAYPNFPRAYRVRGQIEQRRANYEQAKEDYKKAIELDPRTPETYMLLGQLFQQYLEQPKEAIQYYDEYLKQGGTEVDRVTRWRGECIRAAGGTTSDVDTSSTASSTSSNL
jgi:tetratricopeptide (TPR) repeat protein